MSGSSATSERDPLDLLVEQFLAARRSDGKLSVAAFAARHPTHAAELLDLLPTIVALEEHKRDRASSGSSAPRASVPQLERLGEFKIVREIGRGGMGVVFEAVQESLGRKVALKVLPQAALLTGNQLERFRREAQIAAQLHHSNIVPVFGSGESDGYHWYAMQFIVGTSLDHWRDEQQAAPPAGSGAWKARASFVARLGVQAASALHYAHGTGTLHRDIKPGNLLLEPNDHLWVTDFGLAKALEAEGLTHSGDLLGTLQYMAPEQFAGSYDARSEVYALGVTLYELLTLKPAFAGNSRSELMERIRTMRPESLRKLCPDAPEDLVVTVEKAIARDPADRYRDAGALGNDLQAFLDDRPIEARRMSTLGVVWRWCRRNRGVAALAASTLLAFVGAGITGWIAYGVTDDALGRAEDSAREASAQAKIAAQQSTRAEKTLKDSLGFFGEVFDALVGPDPALALEEDEETGEQTVVVRTLVDARDVALLKKMLAFYGQFAAQNVGNQALQLETARANRRVGAICARLGKPEDLETAASTYQQAIAGLQGLTGRDARREIAKVKVELGQLEQRRRRPREAERLFAEALETLASLPSASTKAVRIERAEVHLLLAEAMLPSRRVAGRPGGPAGGRGLPDGGGSPFDADRARLAREHLQQVDLVLDGLLKDEPGNVECQVMKARTQLLSARLTGRRLERGPEGPDREADRKERQRLLDAGVAMLRQVVQAHPRDDYRFRLIEALLESRSRWGEGGGNRGRPDRGGPPDGPDREASVGDDELAVLRECRQLAEQLLTEQPQVAEYRRQAGVVGLELGEALRGVPTGLDAAARTARLQEAETVLQATLRSREASTGAAGDGAAEPRFVLQGIDLRRTLAGVYLAMGRRDPAEAQILAILDEVERQLTAVTKAEPGSGLRQFLEGFDMRHPQLTRFLERLRAPALQQRFATLRQSLLDAGLARLREAVRLHPELPDLRVELIGMLLESRTRWDDQGPARGRPERRPPDGGERDRSVGDAELEMLREAKQHADQLLREQPGVVEHRLRAGSVGLELGEALRTAPAGIDEAARAVRWREAESVLLATLAATHEVAAGPGLIEFRMLLQTVELRRSLAGLYLVMSRSDDAVTQLRDLAADVERRVAALPKGEPLPGLRRLLDAFDSRRGQLEPLLERVAVPELNQRFAALRASLRERAGR